MVIATTIGRMSDYRDWAATYDQVYDAHGKDYAAEAAAIGQIVRARLPHPPRTLLDVACGTGRHLELLRAEFDVVEGLDASPEMLAIAAGRLPGVHLEQGDFRTFDLGRRFDAVTCLFSAIGYVADERELRQAVGAMARHVDPEGVLLVEGWITPDDVNTEHTAQLVVAEGEGRKVVRAGASRVEGGALVVDFHFLVLDGAEVTHFTDTHRLALFTEKQYREAFAAAGMQAEIVFEPPWERRLYVGRR